MGDHPAPCLIKALRLCRLYGPVARVRDDEGRGRHNEYRLFGHAGPNEPLDLPDDARRVERNYEDDLRLFGQFDDGMLPLTVRDSQPRRPEPPVVPTYG